MCLCLLTETKHYLLITEGSECLLAAPYSLWHPEIKIKVFHQIDFYINANFPFLLPVSHYCWSALLHAQWFQELLLCMPNLGSCFWKTWQNNEWLIGLSSGLDLLEAQLLQPSHLSNTHELAVNVKKRDKLLITKETSTSGPQKCWLLYLAYNTNIGTS